MTKLKSGKKMGRQNKNSRAKANNNSVLSRIGRTVRTKRGLLFILAFALIGSFLIYRSFAADGALALPGAGDSSDCTRATGVKVRETRTSNKRNAGVCELAVNKTLQPIQFTYNSKKTATQAQYLSMTNELAGGTGRYFKACYNVSSIGGAASFEILGYAPGATPGSGTRFTQSSGNYSSFCDSVARTSGNTLTALKVTSGTVRVSSVVLERTDAPSPPPSATGKFRVVGSDIIAPDGKKFVPIGANVGIETNPSIPCFAFTQDQKPGGGCYNATGHAQDAANWGWNMIRVNIITEPAFGVSFDQTINGVQKVIDEYTARKIVVMPDAHDNWLFNGDVSLSDSRYQHVHRFWSTIIERNKNNPYFWVNYTNEFSKNSTSSGLSFWRATADEYYRRVRQISPDTMFVVDFPDWANSGARAMANTNAGPEFLAGKSNVAFSWHNYGSSGTASEMTQFANSFKSKNMAIIVGEFGEHWDPTSTYAEWPGGDVHTRRGTKWVFDNFWSIGYGGLWWHGIGSGDNEIFSLHTNGAIAWYRTDQPLSPAGVRLKALPSTKPSSLH